MVSTSTGACSRRQRSPQKLQYQDEFCLPGEQISSINRSVSCADIWSTHLYGGGCNRPRTLASDNPCAHSSGRQRELPPTGSRLWYFGGRIKMSNGTKGTTYNAPEEIRELKGNQFNNYGKAPIQKNRMEPNFVGTGDR